MQQHSLHNGNNRHAEYDWRRAGPTTAIRQLYPALRVDFCIRLNKIEGVKRHMPYEGAHMKTTGKQFRVLLTVIVLMLGVSGVAWAGGSSYGFRFSYGTGRGGYCGSRHGYSFSYSYGYPGYYYAVPRYCPPPRVVVVPPPYYCAPPPVIYYGGGYYRRY